MFTRRQDYVDAAFWVVIPILILGAIHIGGLSGDGVAQGTQYRLHTWRLDPNHLLYEPSSAAWAALWERFAPSVATSDALKRLSIIAGALSLGLFRALVVPRITSDRARANLATLWVCAGAAFVALWLSDEPQMLQMPFLVLLAATLLFASAQPTPLRPLLVGVVGGLATLFYISDVLIVVAGVAALAWTAQRRAGGTMAAKTIAMAAVGGAVVTVPVFGGTWYFTRSPLSFLKWMTSYGGGNVATHGAAGYGVHGSIRDLASATIRAIYGAMSAFVDLSTAVDAVRRHAPVNVILPLALAAFVGGLITLIAVRCWSRSPELRPMILLATAWTAAVVVFGIAWNNADDQFYFQLAVPVGMIAATATLVRTSNVALLALCAYNLATVALPYIRYPRERYQTEIVHAMATADLTIYPGSDEVERLIVSYDGGHREGAIPVTRVASQQKPADGVRLLQDTVRSTLAHCGRVLLLGVVDGPDDVNPWKYLGSIGYARPAIERAVTSLSDTSGPSRVGPVFARWEHAPSSCSTH